MRRADRKLQEVMITTIGGDRRNHQRFAAGLPLDYTVIGSGGLIARGRADTIDLSSGGVAFAPGEVESLVSGNSG